MKWLSWLTTMAFGRLCGCYIVLLSGDADKTGCPCRAEKHVCLLQTEEKDGKMSLWRCHPGVLRFILFEPVWARGEGIEVQWRW